MGFVNDVPSQYCYLVVRPKSSADVFMCAVVYGRNGCDSNGGCAHDCISGYVAAADSSPQCIRCCNISLLCS